MSCFINPVEEDQCVFVTYEGELAAVEIMAARYEAVALVAKKRWNRMVVDINCSRCQLTTMELIGLASDLSSDLPTGARVALVVRPDQITTAKLIERVARNEGVFLTYFSASEQVATWAKGVEPHERTKREPTNRSLEKE
jgi:hypothetical protein